MDKPISYLEEILQTLYDSEINASISWLWDGGIDDKDCDNDFDHSKTVNGMPRICWHTIFICGNPQ